MDLERRTRLGNSVLVTLPEGVVLLMTAGKNAKIQMGALHLPTATLEIVTDFVVAPIHTETESPSTRAIICKVFTLWLPL